MSALFNKQHTKEPAPCSLFVSFVGAASDITVLSHTVDGGSEEFVVGDVVTGDGVGAGTGTILAILASAGVWDGITSTGSATLILTDVTGTFTDDEGVTGAISGVALSDGTGTPGVVPGAPTAVKGKHVTGVTAGPGYDATTLVAQDGRMTVTLPDVWSGLLVVKSCVISAATPADWVIMLESEAVATRATRTIVFRMFKDGAATSPTADEVVKLELVLATSSMLPLSY